MLNCRPITESAVRQLCNRVKAILAEESNIVSVDSPVYLAGDVHGQFYDVKNLLTKGGGVPASKFIMIGDFVDRGYHSVETITLLFCLKVMHPTRIYLLRGNHESRNVTMMYGFLDEINKKYGNSNCWKYFYEAFDFLPLGSIVNGNVLCVHGGLSPDLPTIDQMRLLDRKQEIPHEGPLADLMWSDPENIESWRRNSRGAGWIFGHKVVDQFNLLNEVNLIVRAHQLVQEGYIYWFNEQLVTLWSAPNYCYRMGNKAALLHLDEYSNRDFIIFETVEESSQSKHYRNLMPYFL